MSAATEASFMTIFDAYLTGNTATVNGGGLAVELNGSGASVSVQNVSVLDNHAAYAGGVDGQVLSAADMSLYNSTIAGNTSDGNGGGTRIEVVGSSFFSDNNSFLDNSSLTGGGGLAVIASQDSFFTGGRTTFSGNAAGTLGGGVFAMSLTGSDVRFNDSKFFENTASQGGGFASLTSGDSTIRVADTALYRNEASDFGGGAFLTSYGGADQTIFNHTTVSENFAGLRGGGVYLDASQQPVRFEHSTIAANEQGDDADGGGIL